MSNSETSGEEGSVRVVLVALAGNLAIVVVKLVAFALTRSSAMLTEAIHSAVDTCDQLLLLIGQTRSRRPSDASHPFGYGMETFFWSFIVALMIFLLGGAASIWQGVTKLIHPEAIDRPWVNFIVLALCAAFEASSFTVAYREFRRFMHGRPRIGVFRFLALSKDPSLFATLLEDGAALAGLAIAAVGVAASALGLLWADGAASVAIGLLLTVVALFLANETRSLIAGEAAAPPIVEAVRTILDAHGDVAEATDISSLHLGPVSILFAITLRLKVGGTDTPRIFAELEAAIRAADERICSVYFSIAPASPA